MDMFLLDDSDSEDTDISEGEAMGGSPQPDKPEGTPEAPAPEPNDPSQPNPAASTANNSMCYTVCVKYQCVLRFKYQCVLSTSVC